MRLNESELNIKDADDILSKQIIVDYYPTYSAYLTLMQQFALNYPDLCRIDTMVQWKEGLYYLLLFQIMASK